MSSQRWVAWIVLTAWLVWLSALHAWLARHGSIWAPDLGLVLVFSLLARLETRQAPWLIACAWIARCSLAVEPAAGLAAGLLALVPLVLAVRGMFELTAPAWRAFFCGALVLAFDGWLVLVEHVRGPSSPEPLALSLLALLPVALSSALVSLALGPALAHLPGLTPLRSRKW